MDEAKILASLQKYNPALRSEDIQGISEDLRTMMMEGVDGIYTIIDFLDERIGGGTFRTTIETHWLEQLKEDYELYNFNFNGDEPISVPEDDELDPYDYVMHIGEYDAFLDSELSSVYTLLLPEVNTSTIGEFDTCGECNRLYHPSKMTGFDRMVHTCRNCAYESFDDDEMDDYETVSLIMGGGIPEDAVSEDAPQELMDRLKELIDKGYSKALARVLTMGGYNQDETDYLMENAQQYEDDLKNGDLTSEAYELYKQLLEESNDPNELKFEEYEILRRIRITDY